MIELQFDLFEEIPSELEILRKEVAILKESQDKQRRALFAKQHEQMKLVIELKEELHRVKFELEATRKMLSK